MHECSAGNEVKRNFTYENPCGQDERFFYPTYIAIVSTLTYCHILSYFLVNYVSTFSELFPFFL